MDNSTPTPPRSCGLALALPTSLTAVEQALVGGPYADYIGPSAGRGGASALWANSFRAVATAAEALAGSAGQRGVRVIENATLGDLAGLFQTCRVVTVVAHWRGPEFSKDDVIAGPEEIIDRLVHDHGELPTRLRAGFQGSWRNWLSASASDEIRRSRLAELLNTRLAQGPILLAPPPGTEWHMDLITLRHENRAALDAWWPTAFRPGNRLELADGLHSAQSVSSTVPPWWDGIADFSNCRSAQLADLVKQNSPDRIVIANEHETKALSRIALLSVVYDLLSSGAGNYAAMRVALALRIRKEIQNYE